MAKKPKSGARDDAPNPASVANRDILQRLNFLCQASVLLNGIAAGGSSAAAGPAAGPSQTRVEGREERFRETGETEQINRAPEVGGEKTQKEATREKRKNTKRGKRVVGASELARGYIKDMKIVGQKTTVKMDPSVKRTLCKGCSTVLVPGASATVRVKPSAQHGHAITYTCMHCGTSRRLPAPRTLGADADGAAEPSEALESAEPSAPGPARGKRRMRGAPPRPAPLFERKVGHVVFRGGERVDADASAGAGAGAEAQDA